LSSYNFCQSFFAQQATGSGSTASVGVIAGAALGGLVAAVVVIFVILWMIRRRRRTGATDFSTANLLKVYTVENPSYGHMSPEDAVTPNFLRCVSYNMWKGNRLVALPDIAVMTTHDLLKLPRPPPTLLGALRQHTTEFLDTVVPVTPLVISDALIDDVVGFLFEAFPDLLTEVGIDAVAATGGAEGVYSEDQLYEQFYACLRDAVAYEQIGNEALYDETLEPDFMMRNSGYMETTDDPAYNLAMARPSTYSFATNNNTMNSTDGEATYAMAASTLTRPNYDSDTLEESSPYALPTDDPGEDDEPVYSPANGEATYSFATNMPGSAEATYDRATSGGKDEPEYALAASLGHNDAHDEPVYDISDDAA